MRSTVSPPAVLRLARAPPCAAEPEPFVVCVMPIHLGDLWSVWFVRRLVFWVVPLRADGEGPCWWPSAADAFPSARRRRRLGLRGLGVGGVVAGLDPGRDVLGPQQGDRRLEVLERVEGLVDGGEPQVGDLVELTQRLERGQPGRMGGPRGGPGGSRGLLGPLGEQRQVGRAGRPALTV